LLRRAKNTAIYLLARAAIALAGLIPTGMTAFAGRVLGRLAHLVARRERTIARRQLADSLRVGPDHAALLVRGVFRHLATSAVELCRLLRKRDDMPAVVLPPAARAALDGALGEGKGVVFVTAHLGNWELMAISLARQGYPISTVAKASYDPRFTRFLDRARAGLGVLAINRDTPGAAAGMLRALRAGRILGLLIDQDTSVPGTFAPFFGRLAHTPVGAAVLATRTGAPAVLGTIRRARGGRHIIDIVRVGPFDDIGEATAMLTAELERRIRRQPSQWVWFHRRWRTRPGGDGTGVGGHLEAA
jgi:KDO2-lipid IV(A) lauroyltransferase